MVIEHGGPSRCFATPGHSTVRVEPDRPRFSTSDGVPVESGTGAVAIRLTATLTATAVTLGPTAGERVDEGRNWSLRGALQNAAMDGTWTAF